MSRVRGTWPRHGEGDCPALGVGTGVGLGVAAGCIRIEAANATRAKAAT